jgi:hypothetical protein
MSLPVILKEEITLTKGDFDETMKLLEEIQAVTKHNMAIDSYWVPCWDDKKNIAIIKPNNIFWLYFWAETGQGSKNAARQAREVFYKIFGVAKPYGTGPDYEIFFTFSILRW